MTLMYNTKNVASHNTAMRERLAGPLYLLELIASIQYGPGQHPRPHVKEGRICKDAKVEVISRLHHGPSELQQQSNSWNATADNCMFMGTKESMPLMIAQRCSAAVARACAWCFETCCTCVPQWHQYQAHYYYT